jgi:hypothetical protein
MTVRMRAASSTVRAIGPMRVLMPMLIMPWRLTSSWVGAMPTTLFIRAGARTDGPVSSAIEAVTKFAATELAEPPLEPPGWRSVSYGFTSVPPKELRQPAAYSPMLALARMMAPASRSFLTKVESCGGRSLA